MEQNKSLMLLDVRIDKATMKKLSSTHFSSDEEEVHSDSSDSSEENDKEDIPKSPNAKD